MRCPATPRIFLVLLFCLALVPQPAIQAAHAQTLKRLSTDPTTVEIGWDQVPKAIMRQHLVNDCEGPDSDRLSVLKPQRHELADKLQLFLVPCQLGAYNAVQRLYLLHSEGEPWVEPLFFAEYWRDFGWRGSDRLINPEFDPESRTLRVLAQSRGIGDCGSAAEYIWSDHAFKMMEYRYWHECDGTRFPDQWPVIYKGLN